MEFLSGYNFIMSYHRGKANANVDVLSQLSLLPTEEGINFRLLCPVEPGRPWRVPQPRLGPYTVFLPYPRIGVGGLAARVRRFGASFASPVTTPVFGPLRLHVLPCPVHRCNE